MMSEKRTPEAIARELVDSDAFPHLNDENRCQAIMLIREAITTERQEIDRLKTELAKGPTVNDDLRCEVEYLKCAVVKRDALVDELLDILSEIESHSKAPFAKADPRTDNWKWLNYVNDVAGKALSEYRKAVGE